MQVVLSLISALLFALGTVLQQKAGMEAPASPTTGGVLVRMARQRVWLAGIASDVVGLIAQAVALSVGQLAVVQPLLALSVVFALPLGARISGQRIDRRETAAATLVVLALAGFLAIANLTGGRNEVSLRDWIVPGMVCAVVCVPLALAGRNGPPSRRAAAMGAAAGILFAVSAGLIKLVVDELQFGVVHVLTSWELYALAAIGYVSMTLNQLALNTGALAATLASSTALDPVVSVGLGLAVFEEHVHAGVAQAAGAFVALAVGLCGIVVLARAEAPDTPAQAAAEMSSDREPAGDGVGEQPALAGEPDPSVTDRHSSSG